MNAWEAIGLIGGLGLALVLVLRAISKPASGISVAVDIEKKYQDAEKALESPTSEEIVAKLNPKDVLKALNEKN